MMPGKALRSSLPALFALGCAATPPAVPPPAANPPVEGSPSLVELPALEAEGDLERWLDGDCFAQSEDRAEIACVVADLDMGFVTAHFLRLSAKTSEVLQTLTLYDGPSTIDAGHTKTSERKAAANALETGRFRPAGELVALGEVVLDGVTVTVSQEERTFTATTPTLSAADAPEGFGGSLDACLDWTAIQAWSFEDVVIARLGLAHRFTATEGDPCYVATEVNDETYRPAPRWVALAEKPAN
ncbi:MAG: hypothetical protein KC731_22170 [Myxococcales bacterium]|nr:hypothetical protein [Myxococcales bacterium]